ncbi:recombinase family protein [Pseudomonas sp. C1C7]|nr:recombinase family protein [Pseudomonas sp. C1C7]
MERHGFKRLLEKLETGDVLLVTKLDRLGRNAMDVRKTVEHLESQGVRVHCLALGGVDLTSAAGKMTMQVLGAVAEFERDLLIERTQAGVARARAEGKRPGRPEATGTTKAVQRLKATGLTQVEVATALAKGIATIKRHWNRIEVEA